MFCRIIRSRNSFQLKYYVHSFVALAMWRHSFSCFSRKKFWFLIYRLICLIIWRVFIKYLLVFCTSVIQQMLKDLDKNLSPSSRTNPCSVMQIFNSSKKNLHHSHWTFTLLSDFCNMKILYIFPALFFHKFADTFTA